MSSIALPTLSIKQPWATLVVLGRKTIEIRRWSTPIRGPILIHTGQVADDRPEGWQLVPKEAGDLPDLRGGVIGAVDLVECLCYETARGFARDRQLHWNDPGWFLPPRLFGLRFEAPRRVSFHPCPGQVKFFQVTLPTSKRIVRFEIDSAPPRRKTATRRRA